MTIKNQRHLMLSKNVVTPSISVEEKWKRQTDVPCPKLTVLVVLKQCRVPLKIRPNTVYNRNIPLYECVHSMTDSNGIVNTYKDILCVPKQVY